MQILGQLRSAWQRHGFFKFVYLVFYNVFDQVRRRVSPRPEPALLGADFDRQYGVDTARPTEIGDMKVTAESARHAHRYQTAHVAMITRAIAALPIEHGRFTFVDFGSGKGRVLMLASAFPFARILGVEFSEELHRICEANLAKYRDPAQRCTQLGSVCCDAAAYALPPGPLVAYFYNPFEQPLLARVVANLEAKAQDEGQPVFVVYVDPVLAGVFAAERWNTVHATGDYVLFEARR